MGAKGNARSSGYERNEYDWYVEPRRAVDALLNVETFVGECWDPCCGGGNIPEACEARGIECVASDIVDRGYARAFQKNFLLIPAAPAFVLNAILNPPFDKATEFALHALTLVSGKICILQRTSWLEGERRYQALFSKNHLMRVWQFRSRISMPPGGQDIPAKNGSIAYAWYVFSREYDGAPTLVWLP